MWKGIALAILFTIIPGANAGDDGDDFSNNLFSDLAPVLSLFGEQVAKQFMSQSMYWEDDIIFAMAPLGVLTAIVGAIRVGGPTWMKALIGRARENRAAAEVELMSSTSTDVCELWNGQTIVRMMGAPTILELIYFPERTHEADCGIYTLEEARKKKLVQLSKKSSSTRLIGIPHAGDEEEHAQPTRKRNKQLASAAPNIFLNLRPRKSRLEARLFAALGIAIQVAVFIFAAETTYDLNYKKAGRAVPQYAFPLMTAGTVILELGMFLCSYVVEWYTKEGVWEFGENENASLLWLQKGANVNDQVFGSYAIFAKGKRDSILTSRLYANHVTSPNQPGDFDDQGVLTRVDSSRSARARSRMLHSSNFLQSLVVTATIVSLFGFVIQFIGLRGMNWSTTVAQLVATMAMVVVRAWIRRGLALRPTVRNTPPGHELDWLASRMAGAPDDGLGKDDEEKSADDDDERQFQSETCWSWIIVTGGDISSCHFREVEMDLSLDQIEVQDTDIESSAGEDTEDKDDSNDDRSTTSDNELRIRLKAAAARDLYKDDSHDESSENLAADMESEDTNSVERGNGRGQRSSQATVAEIKTTSGTQRRKTVRFDSNPSNPVKAVRFVENYSDEEDLDNEDDESSEDATDPGAANDHGGTSGNAGSNTIQGSPMDQAVKIRQRLGLLGRWVNTASEPSIMVAHAIDSVMNTLFPRKPGRRIQVAWPMQGSQVPPSERIELSVQCGSNGRWTANTTEIEAALSLWLHSVSQYEREIESEPGADNNGIHDESDRRRGVYIQDWLREGDGALRKQSIRLLGEYKASDYLTDLNWFLGSAINSLCVVKEHTQKDEEKIGDDNQSNMSTESDIIRIDRHRVLGFKKLVDKKKYTPPANLINVSSFRRSEFKATALIENDAKDQYIACISDNPLEKCLAQEIFANFMWAVADKVHKRLAGETIVKGSSAATSDNTEDIDWLSCKLENTTLAKLAREVQRSGLANSEEAYLLIVPPLSLEKKLPLGSSMIDNGMDRVRHLEKTGKWQDACRIHISVLHACKAARAAPDHVDTMAAIVVLYEFANTVAQTASLHRRHYLKEEVDTQFLDMLELVRKDVIQELEKCDHSVLHKIIQSYKQRNLDGYERLELYPSKIPLDIEINRSKWASDVQNRLNSPSALYFGRRDIECQNELGMTLLHQATFLRKWRWVNLLRKHEANSNAVDLFRWTPLHYHAAVNSNAYGRLSAIEPISLLITAVSVNAQDLSGFTPLHYAAQSGSVDLVTLLLSKSADLSIRGRKGEVPLALAARNGHTKVVEALLDEGDIEQDHVNQVDNGGRTPLHWAASYGHYDVVKRLIDKDAKKQAPDAKKRSPLHYLAFYKLGSRKKNTLIEIDRLALLLDDKTSDFPKDYIEQTPLHLAACTENADIVRILLQRNPDVDMVDLNGRTPLHISARAGNYEITALLLEKSAKTGIRIKEDPGTALTMACHYYGQESSVSIELIQLETPESLSKSIVESTRKNKIKEMKVLLDLGADANYVSEENKSLISYSAFDGRISGVTGPPPETSTTYMLLSYGADFDITTDILYFLFPQLPVDRYSTWWTLSSADLAWASDQPWYMNVVQRFDQKLNQSKYRQSLATYGILSKSLKLPINITRSILKECGLYTLSTAVTAFKSPQRYSEDDDEPCLSIKVPGPVRSVTFFTASCDQGDSWNTEWHGTYMASYSWFDAVIRPKTTTVNKVSRRQHIQYNVHASDKPRFHVNEWHYENSTKPIRNWIKSINAGDTIEVYASAQYGGWYNMVSEVRIELECEHVAD